MAVRVILGKWLDLQRKRGIAASFCGSLLGISIGTTTAGAVSDPPNVVMLGLGTASALGAVLLGLRARQLGKDADACVSEAGDAAEAEAADTWPPKGDA